jgi:hypothetical protein
MAYQIGAHKDQQMPEPYSRGYAAVYRKVGAEKWLFCRVDLGSGHGAVRIWEASPEAAKAAARAWLKKQLAKSRRKAA